MDLTQAELLLKLASLHLQLNKEGKNFHYHRRVRDDLPKEIKWVAKWYKAPDQDWGYMINRENKLRYVEYINDNWYWTGWNGNAWQFHTNITKKIEKPELLGLGTKAKPILQEQDHRRIEKAPAIDDTSDGHKAEPS